MSLNNIPRFDNHSHSEYSNIRLIDSICKAGDMIQTASKLGMKGLALTDHECVSGHIKFLEEGERLKKEGKIPEDFKCALGNEIYLVDKRDDIVKFFHYILIAKDTIGHRALRELSSIAWLNCFSSKGLTRVPTEKNELKEIVNKYKGHLIATTACLGGELPYYLDKYNELKKKIKSEQTIEVKKELAECELNIKEFLNFNLDLFGEDFYIEIAAAASTDQINFNKTVKELAKQYGIKIVIGSDSHYLTAKERAMHKAYLNSKEADREVDDFYFYAHMMDNNEAYENLSTIFTEEEFIELCKNSMEIYDKIGTYELFHNPIIPQVNVFEYPKNMFSDEVPETYPVLKSLLNSDNAQERYWVNKCLEELVNRKLINEIYLKRLETEARIIKIISEKLENCLFEYFNTFKHYIDLFWDNGSIVGPGRGSAVCFLSNYLLGITQLDPIKWDLAEWRFLNEERVELPDIDIDLAPSRRKQIFDAIRKERGELNLIQVCTFKTEGTRSAIATACRGYRSIEYPRGIEVETAQFLSSLVPQERGFLWSISDVVYGNEEKGRKPNQIFIQEINKYPGLLEIIISIEGLICGRGQHASGVILYNNSPFETNAIMKSPNGDLTTQFELHTSEKLGDVKYDKKIILQ